MRLRKYHPHQSVLFVTFSVEEGLLLLANPLCLTLVKSALSAAQELYPVIISHFIVQATHLHLLMVVDDPEDVRNFIRYFKTESAHLINRLLGRRKRTIWCEGYDSPVVLTPEKALSVIAYLYANPAKDNLIDTIDSFPGLSSWKMFQRKTYSKVWKRIRRPAVRALPHHSSRAYTDEAERLLKDSSSKHTFSIQPNAWLTALGITSPEEQESWNKAVVEAVREREEEAAHTRQGKVMGRERLLNRAIDPYYRPERSGKRMCCLSDDRPLRVQFINFLKGLYTIAAEVAERWRQGDFSLPFPPGLYPPSFPKLCEPLTAW